MQLAWMGEYRDIIEKLIKYCNIYAACYSKETYHGTDIPFSFSQIQVLEYLLENEDLHQNMTTIADRLGITYSTFSKLTSKLQNKGLIDKFHAKGNRKDVVIRVSETGKRVYSEYSDYINDIHFSKMFEIADGIPREYLPLIASFLDAGHNHLKSDKPVDSTIELIPIKTEKE